MVGFMDGWICFKCAFLVLFLCSMIPLFVVLFVPRIHSRPVMWSCLVF